MEGLRDQSSFMKRIFIVILFGLAHRPFCVWGDESSSQSKIVPPVDTDKSMDRSTFQADYDQVWQTLDDLLTEYGFKFKIETNPSGRLETGLRHFFT